MTATLNTAAGMIEILVGAIALPAVVSSLTKTKTKRRPARPTNVLQARVGFRLGCMLDPLRPELPEQYLQPLRHLETLDFIRFLLLSEAVKKKYPERLGVENYEQC